MNIKTFFFVTILCCAGGGVIFLIQRNWIVIQIPYNPLKSLQTTHAELQTTSRNIRVFYKKNDTWLHDTATVIWDNSNMAQNFTHLLQQWLTVLCGEKVRLRFFDLRKR